MNVKVHLSPNYQELSKRSDSLVGTKMFLVSWLSAFAPLPKCWEDEVKQVDDILGL